MAVVRPHDRGGGEGDAEHATRGSKCQSNESLGTQSSTTKEDHGVTSGDDALNGVFISSEEIDMDVAVSMMAALNPPTAEDLFGNRSSNTGGDGLNTGDTHRMVMVGSDAVGSEMDTERVIMEGTEVAKDKR